MLKRVNLILAVIIFLLLASCGPNDENKEPALFEVEYTVNFDYGKKIECEDGTSAESVMQDMILSFLSPVFSSNMTVAVKTFAHDDKKVAVTFALESENPYTEEFLNKTTVWVGDTLKVIFDTDVINYRITKDSR